MNNHNKATQEYSSFLRTQESSSFMVMDTRVREYDGERIFQRPAKKLGLVLLLTSSLLITACSSTAPQNSLMPVQTALEQNFPGASLDADHTVSSTTKEPLQLTAAIQLLLSHSPQVRMQLAQLGVADAQQLQAELISNPHISIGAMRPEGGGRWQLETGLSQPLLELFTRPLRRQLAQDNLLRAQLQLQAELQELIVQTQSHYYSALAAAQHLQIQTQVLDAAKAQMQLALSLYRAGNMAENQFLYYDNELRRVQQQFNQRRLAAKNARLTLLNFIGLPSSTTLTLPTQLPALQPETFDRDQLMAEANSHRLDNKIIQQQLTLASKRRTLLARENGWRDISVGINAEREADGAKNIGPEVEFALPIFNRNQGKLAALDAQVAQLQAKLQQHELAADLEIAQALLALETAQTQLALITQSLQVAEKRTALAQREVNFMLTSPFELLEIKRNEIQLAHDYTKELKNYWLARSQLELSIGKKLPISTGKPDHSQMDHSEMDHSKMDHSTMNHAEMDHSSHQSHSDHADKNTSEEQEHQHD